MLLVGPEYRPSPLTDNDGRYFNSSTHDAAYKALHQALTRQPGWVCLVGEPGSGKTELLARLIRTSAMPPTPLKFSYLSAEQLAGGPLVETICDRLDNAPGDCPMGILLDDASSLNDNDINSLAILLNSQLAHNCQLRLVLAGAPALYDRIRQQFAKHSVPDSLGSVTLQPFANAEQAAFIFHLLHRLPAHDADLGLPQELVALISDYAGGLPGEIVTLCERALAIAQRSGDDNINLDTVHRAIETLELSDQQMPTCPALTDQEVAAKTVPTATLNKHSDRWQAGLIVVGAFAAGIACALFYLHALPLLMNLAKPDRPLVTDTVISTDTNTYIDIILPKE